MRAVPERGLEEDHTTILRWVQRYGPELEERLRRHLKPTNKSWRVDETYVSVKGRWCCLYRAIDSTGATIDFVLSGLRDGGKLLGHRRRQARSMHGPFSGFAWAVYGSFRPGISRIFQAILNYC